MLHLSLASGTLVSAFALLLYTFYLGQGDQRLPKLGLSKDEMKPFSVYGAFYANPQDGSGWVPKMWGYGWTVNMRTRQNVHIFIALLGICLASALVQTAFALCNL